MVAEVTYIPAKCAQCGEQLALIAVAPEWAGTSIALNTAHECKEKADGKEKEEPVSQS